MTSVTLLLLVNIFIIWESTHVRMEYFPVDISQNVRNDFLIYQTCMYFQNMKSETQETVRYNNVLLTS